MKYMEKDKGKIWSDHIYCSKGNFYLQLFAAINDKCASNVKLYITTLIFFESQLINYREVGIQEKIKKAETTVRILTLVRK